jgi:hypothetical protein
LLLLLMVVVGSMAAWRDPGLPPPRLPPCSFPVAALQPVAVVAALLQLKFVGLRLATIGDYRYHHRCCLLVALPFTTTTTAATTTTTVTDAGFYRFC